MKKIIAFVLFLGLMATAPGWASETPAEGAAEPSKWKKAGEEISEAADAVGEATADSSKKAWEATKEGSAEAWEATKDKSKELWEEGKARVHEATAPEDEEAETAGEKAAE